MVRTPLDLKSRKSTSNLFAPMCPESPIYKDFPAFISNNLSKNKAEKLESLPEIVKSIKIYETLSKDFCRFILAFAMPASNVAPGHDFIKHPGRFCLH